MHWLEWQNNGRFYAWLNYKVKLNTVIFVVYDVSFSEFLNENVIIIGK